MLEQKSAVKRCKPMKLNAAHSLAQAVLIRFYALVRRDGGRQGIYDLQDHVRSVDAK